MTRSISDTGASNRRPRRALVRLSCRLHRPPALACGGLIGPMVRSTSSGHDPPATTTVRALHHGFQFAAAVVVRLADATPGIPHRSRGWRLALQASFSSRAQLLQRSISPQRGRARSARSS